MADKDTKDTKPKVIRNFREFKQSKKGDRSYPGGEPEVVKAKPHVSPVEAPKPSAPLPETPEPQVGKVVTPEVFMDSKEILDFLKNNAPALPAGVTVSEPTASSVPVGSQVGDGVLATDPNKVVIGGKTYEVLAEAAADQKPAAAAEQEKIVTADVVETYVPQNEFQATELSVCVVPPAGFELGKHPWLYDEAVASVQLCLLRIDKRHRFFLAVQEETALYPIEFVYLKGGVKVTSRVKTCERIYADSLKFEDAHYKEAFEKANGMMKMSKSTIPVQISVRRCENAVLLCITFPERIEVNDICMLQRG